ncbi:DUF2922 family protein [Terrilactibacillus sp. BCM23-1]|uniref:DUF2922 family protein n=1 Tax=Terrilactibacillus tamarindi TaxID=2599694 RepID=A0A6N8CQQ5_9BACI|nr:DUF2922 domain-containing protein [Terrilactibacillus tamarindi]MTT32361.1 DUF2922 family protein [Terrilactibacillus tamarindi]
MKTLQLQFENTTGGTVSLTLDNPVEPVNPAAIQAAQAAIISQNVFTSTGGDYVKVKGAKIIERNVTDIALS